MTATGYRSRGEGTYVNALATLNNGTVTTVFVNYDENNRNIELVPVTYINLPDGTYSLTFSYLDGNTTTIPPVAVTNHTLKRSVLMQPNAVIALQLIPQFPPQSNP